MGLKKLFSTSSSSQDSTYSKRNSSRSSLSLSWTPKEGRRSSTFTRNSKIIQNERHSISFDEKEPVRNSLSSGSTTLSEDEKHSQFIHMSTPKQVYPTHFYHNDDDSPDSATTLYTNLEKASLSSDLLAVQHQLYSFHPQNVNEMNQHLQNVNKCLSKALSTSTYLESKTKNITETSKAVIVSLEEKLKQNHDLLIQERKQITVTQELLKEYPGRNLYDSVKQILDALHQCQEQKLDLERQLVQSRQTLQQQQAAFEVEKKQLLKEKQQMERDFAKEKEQLRNEQESAVEEEEQTRSDNVLIKRLDRERLINENQALRERVIEIEQVSKETATFMMDANERLEQRIQQLEENASMAIQENVALNEEIDLLSKKSKGRAVVDENLQLKTQLQNIQQENLNLTEMTKCLQDKLKEFSKEGGSDKMRQEELMQMHTRAQLGLIEYLEGEDDVLTAMIKFKKQLEADCLLFIT